VHRSVTATRLAALLPERTPGAPAYSRLAESIRLLILDGQLVADLRLPSERELSQALRLSRSTVAGAYALLRDRGLLTARRGAGNYVTAASESVASELLPSPAFSRDGVIGLTCASSEAPPGLAAAYAQALDHLPGLLAGTGYFPDGLPMLRERLAAWFTARGLSTSADQLIVTAGALAGLNVIARGLLGSGDRVLLESPTYSNAISALTKAGARAVALPVGGPAEAWETQHLEETLSAAGPRYAYLIPDFHNPTGYLMPAPRRAAVAAALRRHRTVTIIDESLVELALDDVATPPPFASFAPGAITLGSASKAFWGGLRVGWIRAPRALASSW
jgi:DNA-binding transcriptional MocR family regulator